MSYRCTEQIRPLIDTGPNQQAPVGATLYDYLVVIGITVLHQKLRRILEIVEDVLLLQQPAGIVPPFAVFTGIRIAGWNYELNLHRNLGYNLPATPNVRVC